VVDGDLTDNYDPRSRTLNLSRGVAEGRSVASEAVVAHEIGHAQQDQQGYFAMRWRSGLVPAANLGSQAGPMIVIAGVLLSAFTRSSIGFYVAFAGLILFAGVVAFQLITTPVELNASHRALGLLAENGVILPEEQDGARRMLRAAAFTYWVALFGAILTLLYYASLVLGSRRDDCKAAVRDRGPRAASGWPGRRRGTSLPRHAGLAMVLALAGAILCGHADPVGGGPASP
jgi:uncharacterized protein